MSNPHEFSGREKIVGWIWVAVQFLLLAIMVLFPRDSAWIPTALMITLGTVLTVVSVVIGVWGALYLGTGLTASPLPNVRAKLATKGPYRFVRHPIYTAVMILGVGITLRSGSIMVALAFVGLIVLFSLKARWEETRLAISFPGYSDYMTMTGRFFPRMSK